MKKYKIPNCANYTKRTRNVICINAHNSLKHELKKAELGWKLKKEGKEFITEAQCKRTGDIIDLISLDDGCEYEIIHTHGEKKCLQRGRTLVRA